MDILNGILSALTNGNPVEDVWWVFPLLVLTIGVIWYLKGRFWALLYVATIPFLNWSFGVVEPWSLVPISEAWPKGVELHPLTMVTGLVFVFRDFVQREMGHRVLIIMAMAIAWSFFYAWPVIALASGIAFAVSEIADWLLFTFTKYRLSTRILLSSALASPIDTTIFLYGADLALQINDGKELGYGLFGLPIADGNMLHPANWVVFIIGKMVGAFVVSYLVRKREDAGQINPHEA